METLGSYETSDASFNATRKESTKLEPLAAGNRAVHAVKSVTLAAEY